MANMSTQEEVESVLSSIRRLVGSAKNEETDWVDQGSKDMFVLTPQLRVSDASGVLRLMPESAVAPEVDRFDFAEAPEPFVLGPAVQNAASDPEPELSEPHMEPLNISELSAKIAALETAISKTVDDWEPDDTGQDAYSGTRSPTVTWHDDVELDGRGAPISPSVAPEDRTEEVAEDDESLLLDEDMLRQVVSQIVRSELQGELGERITRNVRKLVRREIQRALMERDVD